VLLGLLLVQAAVSQAAELPGNGAAGWYSWRVPVVDTAPELCCFNRSNGVTSQQHCNLDGRRGSFSTADDSPYPSDEVQVYAFMDAGVATKIRVLGSQCPVTSDSAIAELGSVAATDSVNWLQAYFAPQSGVSEDAIAAVAVHAGDPARRVLVETARSDASEENRETAVFWMGQARIGETAADLRAIMFEDRSADLREHAGFSHSQSNAADRNAMLIRQGKEDPDADVRSQAWFWLAQTGAPESEREILAAISKESDAEVREDAVFALSQLPEERAVSALTGILEDRSFDISTREQALFWLAQTESDVAYEYVERLLTKEM
jgi:hypothetical protein